MQLKIYKPQNNSLRHRAILSKKDNLLFKDPKSLKKGLKRHSGRNNKGRITVRSRGGGHRYSHRLIENQIYSFNTEGKVLGIKYNPAKSALVGLISYRDGTYSYRPIPDNYKATPITNYGNLLNDAINLKNQLNTGDTVALIHIPVGSYINNIEMVPGQGSKYIRSAGTYGKLIQKYSNGYAAVLLPSKEVRFLPLFSYASIGRLSNINYNKQIKGKAGSSIWSNRRPSVRGVAMNPVDHPHGGGEGKSKGNNPMTPWGKPTQGYKTKRRKSRYIL